MDGPARELRGLSAQEREPALSIEIGDLESRRLGGGGFSRSAARRVDGGLMERDEAEVELGRSGAAESLVGPEAGVVDEALVYAALEV